MSPREYYRIEFLSITGMRKMVTLGTLSTLFMLSTYSLTLSGWLKADTSWAEIPILRDEAVEL